MPRLIRDKRKYHHDRGDLDEGKIKKRMEKFGVEPIAMLKRGLTSREAKMGRNMDRSKARGGGLGDMGTSRWTLLPPSYWRPTGRCRR